MLPSALATRNVSRSALLTKTCANSELCREYGRRVAPRHRYQSWEKPHTVNKLERNHKEREHTGGEAATANPIMTEFYQRMQNLHDFARPQAENHNTSGWMFPRKSPYLPPSSDALFQELSVEYRAGRMNAAEVQRRMWETLYEAPPTFNRKPVNPLPRRVESVIHYKNIRLLCNFLTEGGRIIPARESGLKRPVQFKLKKAVMRARFMGFIPFTGNPFYTFQKDTNARKRVVDEMPYDKKLEFVESTVPTKEEQKEAMKPLDKGMKYYLELLVNSKRQPTFMHPKLSPDMDRPMVDELASKKRTSIEDEVSAEAELDYEPSLTSKERGADGSRYEYSSDDNR